MNRSSSTKSLASRRAMPSSATKRPKGCRSPVIIEADTLEEPESGDSAHNPAVGAAEFRYRVRGSVRNELWQGMPGVTVQIWKNSSPGKGPNSRNARPARKDFSTFPTIRLATPPQTDQAAFPPADQAVDRRTTEIGSKLLFNPTQIAWTNFTKGDQPYRGTSEFDARLAAVAKASATAKLATWSKRRQPADHAGRADCRSDAEDVMRLVLAHRVAARINHPPVGRGEACYAYIAQNLPSTLPGDLLGSTEDWTLIENWSTWPPTAWCSWTTISRRWHSTTRSR